MRRLTNLALAATVAVLAAGCAAGCAAPQTVTVDTSSTSATSTSPEEEADDHAQQVVGMSEADLSAYVDAHDLDMHVTKRGPEQHEAPEVGAEQLIVTLEQFPSDDTWTVATATYTDADGTSTSATYDGPSGE